MLIGLSTMLEEFNEDWAYFRIAPDVKLELVPVADGNVQAVIPVRR